MYWEDQAPVHYAAGTLTRAYIHAFEALCLVWADVRAATTPSGRRSAVATYRGLATDFGATPAAATRIKATPPDAHRDPVTDYQRRRPAHPA